MFKTEVVLRKTDIVASIDSQLEYTHTLEYAHAQCGENIRTDEETRSSKVLWCNYLCLCDLFLLY